MALFINYRSDEESRKAKWKNGVWGKIRLQKCYDIII